MKMKVKLVESIYNLAKKINRKYVIILIVILLIGFSVRFYYSQTIRIDEDEGNYLYDALQVAHGKVPFKDFMTRSPVFIYTLSFLIEIFGNSLIVGRGLSVFSALVITAFIYLIGKELYSEQIGLISSLLYAILPISVRWNSIVLTESLQMMWIVIALYFLIKGLQSNKYQYYIITGGFFALAFFTRRSTAILIVTLPLLLLYVHNLNIKQVLKNLIFVALGGSIVAVPLLAYLISQTSISLIWLKLGFGGVSALYSQEGSMLVERAFVLYLASREGLYAIFPVFILFAYLVKKYILEDRSMLHKVLWLTLGIFGFIAIVIGYLYIPHPAPYITLPIFLILSVAFFVVSLFLADTIYEIKQKNKFSNVFMIYWFSSIFYFYLTYYKWHLHYFTELLPAASIMFGIVVFAKTREFNNSMVKKFPLKKVFILLVIFSIGLAHFQYFFSIGPNWGTWTVSEVSEVSDYISNNTSTDEEIFTASSMIAFLSDRPLVYEISHATAYARSNSSTIHPMEAYPSIRELMEYLDDKKTRYIVLDNYTTYCYFSQHPEFEEYIYLHYKLEKSIQNTEIYSRI